MKLQGYDKVMRNLNREIKKIRKTTRAGLWEAGLVIKGDALRITPRDLSNLAGSCFVTVTKWKPDTDNGNFTGDEAGRMEADHSRSKVDMKKVTDGPMYRYSATVAYSAHYAFYVHEMTGNVNWNSPGTGPQFLIKSVRKNQPRVLRILAKHAKF
jgi:hypothetical protein